MTLNDHAATLAGPACSDCGKSTRLTGIEPHPTEQHTDLRTYQCVVCDAVQVQAVPLR
jgi:hypothetical protein